jgi:hypothetical protein
MYFIKIVTFFMGFAALGFVQSAHAEGGCPPGQVPQQGNGWKTCVPSGNAGGVQDGDTPGVSVSPRWIALSVDAPKGAIGESRESFSRDESEASATDDCHAKGGIECKIVGSAMNGCVSMATGSTTYGTGIGPSPDEAKAAAVGKCSGGGATGCGVIYVKCAFAGPR